MMSNSQKGVSLIITFLIMTTALAIILSVSTILFTQIKILRNLGNSVGSFYAAESGTEEMLYFDRKIIPGGGASRGFCNICSACSGAGCVNCITAPLDAGSIGCDLVNCAECQITYNTTMGNKSYSIDARVIPNAITPGLYDFIIQSRGLYKETNRAIEIITTN